MENDKTLLNRAIELAGFSLENGGGPFGAVIVREGKIISEAFNRVVLDNDPTAHAEILSIRQASSSIRSHDLSDCVIYSSSEPCPMCLAAIYWAGIKKVVYATDRYDAARAGFNDNNIYNEIKLEPDKREIAFLHLPLPGGKEIFKRWEELEDKTPY
jgi:guanine deaminase